MKCMSLGRMLVLLAIALVVAALAGIFQIAPVTAAPALVPLA